MFLALTLTTGYIIYLPRWAETLRVNSNSLNFLRISGIVVSRWYQRTYVIAGAAGVVSRYVTRVYVNYHGHQCSMACASVHAPTITKNGTIISENININTPSSS